MGTQKKILSYRRQIKAPKVQAILCKAAREGDYTKFEQAYFGSLCPWVDQMAASNNAVSGGALLLPTVTTATGSLCDSHW